ncbi:CD99 molecule isoform X2 [Chanos chanos]|uniref:CD99 molecule isoform X2 n=1 Tax=Chanos chanos TaxID=29144 RepID=A0A6J2VWY1_CHACN|nr:CD99 antigen-like protein 2 isoform X2 [Chanos chanos]
MASCLWIFFLACLVTTKAQDLDLGAALDDIDSTTTAPPKASEDSGKVVPAPPKKSGDGGLDLFDALDDTEGDPEPKKPVEPPKEGGTGGDLNILDALDTDSKKPAGDPEPKKPAVNPPKDGGTGGGSFGDDDLADVGNDSGYKPDGGRARAADPGPSDPNAGAGDQPQAAGSGQLAGIVSAIGVALVGAASSYFAYQKKKLCFKIQGGADPESGKDQQGTHSEPQVLSNLLKSS